MVTSGAIEKGRQRTGIVKFRQSAEDRHPGLLNQIPSVGLRSHHAAQVVQKRLLEKSDQLVGRTGVSPLAAEYKQFAKDQVRICHSGVPRESSGTG
jgi:hypothetical protein